MRRVVSVWFPTFPTDRLRRLEAERALAPDPASPITHAPFPDPGQSPELPKITVTGRLVAAVNTTASALGLRAGMKLAQAQSLVAGLVVHDADPSGDAAALRRLAALLQQLADAEHWPWASAATAADRDRESVHPRAVGRARPHPALLHTAESQPAMPPAIRRARSPCRFQDSPDNQR